MKNSPKTTALAIIAIVMAVLGIVQTILGTGIEAVQWGTVVPLIVNSVIGIFTKDDDGVPAASADLK